MNRFVKRAWLLAAERFARQAVESGMSAKKAERCIRQPIVKHIQQREKDARKLQRL